MIDVTAIADVRQGDEVVLIGEQGRDRITAEEVADWLGTINYEVVSELLARIPRIPPRAVLILYVFNSTFSASGPLAR